MIQSYQTSHCCEQRVWRVFFALLFRGSGSEPKLGGLQTGVATSIGGKHTAFQSSNPCWPPIRVSCSAADARLGGIRHWNQTLKYRLRKFFKVGLRSRREGSEPGSVGIFGTSDSFPKTTRATAKSESYELQTTSPPPSSPTRHPPESHPTKTRTTNSETNREIEQRRPTKTEGRRLKAAPGWPGW